MAAANNVTLKVALILLVVGLIIFVVGFAAPYWFKVYIDTGPNLIDRHYYRGVRTAGLWTYCVDYERWDDVPPRGRRQAVDECHDFLPDYRDLISNELRATQFFETVGLIGIVATFVLLLVGLCVKSMREQRLVPIIAAVCCLASAGSIILGTIIYGSTEGNKDNLSWAFALTIVSGIVFIVTGILIIIGAIVSK